MAASSDASAVSALKKALDKSFVKAAIFSTLLSSVYLRIFSKAGFNASDKPSVNPPCVFIASKNFLR